MATVSDLVRRASISYPGNGSPRLLTPEIHAAIMDEVSLGCTLKSAAALAGILPDTANNWRLWGQRHASLPEDYRDPENIYYKFYCDYRRCRLEVAARGAKAWYRMATTPTVKRTTVYREQILYNEDGSVAMDAAGKPVTAKVVEKETVEEIGEGNYTALQEFMARAFAEEDAEQKGWRKTDNVEVTGKDGEDIKVAHTVTLSAEDLDAIPLEVKREMLAIMEKKAAALQAVDEVEGEYSEVVQPGSMPFVPTSLFDFLE